MRTEFVKIAATAYPVSPLPADLRAEFGARSLVTATIEYEGQLRDSDSKADADKT